ncbi:hypothetical protein [Arcticibacter sp.]|uniref:hypothetical protein n=1 Tax=Arcticibacter sp. TaxID=1872630 RepID=UPI00388EEAB7
MANVTEQDVISFLKQRITKLENELKKAQSALDLFTEPSSEEPDEPVAQTVKEAKPGRGTRTNKIKTLSVPEEYNPGLKLDGKIAYVLANNGPSFNTDIISKLQEMEPEKDPEKLVKAVMVKLSSLHKAGRIRGAKEGRKFKYQL